jgi:hypothetical protein
MTTFLAVICRSYKENFPAGKCGLMSLTFAAFGYQRPAIKAENGTSCRMSIMVILHTEA